MSAKPKPSEIRIGVDRLAALQAVLSQPLPKGKLMRSTLAAVALATIKDDGSCAWSVECLAGVIGTQRDRASATLRRLHNQGLVKVYRTNNRIRAVRLAPLQGEPKDPIERSRARRAALSKDFAALVQSTVTPTPHGGRIRFNDGNVIKWAVSLQEGKTMKRAKLAESLGLSVSHCRARVKAETVRDPWGRKTSLRVPLKSVGTSKISASVFSGPTRACAHSSRTTGSVCGEIAMKKREGKGSLFSAPSSATKPALRIVAGSDMIGQGKVMVATAMDQPLTTGDAAQSADEPPPWEPEPPQWEIDDGSPFLRAETRPATRRGAA